MVRGWQAASNMQQAVRCVSINAGALWRAARECAARFGKPKIDKTPVRWGGVRVQLLLQSARIRYIGLA